MSTVLDTADVLEPTHVAAPGEAARHQTAVPVSVIIATYRRGPVLLDTLDYVLGADYPHFEVIVVDQTDAHPPAIQQALDALQRKPHVRYIELPVPNLPFARNVGLRHATGDIVIFCDDDVQFTPDFIANHVRVYEDERVGAVAGRVTLEGGKPWVFDDTGTVGAVHANGDFSANFHAEERREVDWGPGCNMSFRREALVRVGGFDERFGKIGYAYREDGAAFARIKQAGYRVVFEPAAYLVHLTAPTGGCRKDETRVAQMSGVYHNDTLFNLAYVANRRFGRYTYRLLRWIYATAKVHGLGVRGMYAGVAAYVRAIGSYLFSASDEFSQRYQESI